MRPFLPALLLAALTALALPFLRLPAESGAVAAYLGPSVGLREAVATADTAGGRVIRAAGVSGLYILRPARDAETGFHARLRAAGAWLLIDPLVAGGCGQGRPSAPMTAYRPTGADRGMT